MMEVIYDLLRRRLRLTSDQRFGCRLSFRLPSFTTCADFAAILRRAVGSDRRELMGRRGNQRLRQVVTGLRPVERGVRREARAARRFLSRPLTAAPSSMFPVVSSRL